MIYLIFCLGIFNTRCLINAQDVLSKIVNAYFQQIEEIDVFKIMGIEPFECPDTYEPVCAEAKNFYKNGERFKETFRNECELDLHNSRFGNGFYKLKDGQCDCQVCRNDENPLCYSFPDSLNRAFLNQCYYERYICLHGYGAVYSKENDGRCQKCDKKFYPINDLTGERELMYVNCKTDESPLIRE